MDDLTDMEAAGGQRSAPGADGHVSVTDGDGATERRKHALRSVLVAGLIVGAAAFALYPIGIALLLAFFVGSAFVSPLLTSGAGSPAGWVLAIGGAVVFLALLAVFVPRIVDHYNEADPTRQLDPKRFKRLLAVAQPFVLAATGYLTFAAAASPPAFLGQSFSKFVSPARFAWLFVSMEAAAIVLAWFVSRKDLRRWQIALRASGAFWILLFFVPIGGNQTCYDPIFDEVIYPLPPSITVVSDEQMDGGTSHDPPRVRFLVLKHDDQSAEQTARELKSYFVGRGWPMREYSSNRGVTFAGGDGQRWYLTIDTDTYRTNAKTPDGVYLELERENAGAFCLD